MTTTPCSAVHSSSTASSNAFELDFELVVCRAMMNVLDRSASFVDAVVESVQLNAGLRSGWAQERRGGPNAALEWRRKGSLVRKALCAGANHSS
ncbi:hypothetical protein D9611_015115 [Ephemerocybe angulata]|uniref:Uncharacterized protein n=1 Tax=Ephemerocybe angulata TaxID=980116 RepID=A0A8H5CAN9_9AGAR|nr:hypothetical protein D9611_015115 [Tulosesus angulatus]